MQQKTETVGFEVVCNALDCLNNDLPACKEHTERSPIVIGSAGQCMRYKKKDEAGVSED